LDAAGPSDRFAKVKLPYHAPTAVMLIRCQLKKTSGARHAFGSNSSGLFALAQQIVGGP